MILSPYSKQHIYRPTFAFTYGEYVHITDHRSPSRLHMRENVGGSIEQGDVNQTVYKTTKVWEKILGFIFKKKCVNTKYTLNK